MGGVWTGGVGGGGGGRADEVGVGGGNGAQIELDLIIGEDSRRWPSVWCSLMYIMCLIHTHRHLICTHTPMHTCV